MKTPAVNLLVLLIVIPLAFALAKFIAGCAYVPPPPTHVESRVVVDGSDLSASTAWELCATRRACVEMGVEFRDRQICVTVPYFGLASCHEIKETEWVE